jgi:hypothetical protein
MGDDEIFNDEEQIAGVHPCYALEILYNLYPAFL